MNQPMWPQNRGQKILVVGDQPALLEATSELLRSAGHHVLPADTLTRALQLSGPEVGLVVLASNLPDVDRSDVCRQLRAQRGSDYLPIVCLSADRGAGAGQALAASGGDSCVLRADDPAALIATVAALLLARVAMAADVSERRHAEIERERLLANERAARAEVERGNRLKDEFLAMLSHELRNPLNAILGWAKVLGRVPDNTPLIAQGIDAIERNARLQSHLITDLLDFAGIQSGSMRIDLDVIDPAASVQAALDAVASQALVKGVGIESSIAYRGARVLGDALRLQQVVWNLLGNAIKFTPKDGNIKVSAQLRNEFFQIEVADTGQGISPDFLPRIFDRFSQQDSGAAKSFAGLGIGLTIVRHLVDAHRGTIEAYSDGEGRGASFRVRLPLTQQKPLPSLRTGPALLSGIHVLVVEDDGDARALVARLLNDAGARVTEAAGADEALAQVAQAVPHVLVSDIGMAKRDGYQLMRALRAGGHSAERLPAIALTAFTRAEDRHDAIEAGFQIHLAKPVNLEALSAAVAQLGRTLLPPGRQHLD
ncbi:MAG TPA: response regulator [Steroidobacteraceae bacterium]|jgi:signal transduction histidine kinase/ActR/RegA family two-component response regulator